MITDVFIALTVLLGGWFTSLGAHRESGVLSLWPGGVWNDVIAGTYVYVFLTAVLGTACWLRRARLHVRTASWLKPLPRGP